MTWTTDKLVVAAAAAAGLLAGEGAAQPLWSLSKEVAAGRGPANDLPGVALLEVQWDDLVAATEPAGAGAREAPVQIPLPGRAEPASCSLGPSAVVDDDFESRFPNLRALSGPCEDGSWLSITMAADAPGLMYSEVQGMTQTLYVDPVCCGESCGPVAARHRESWASTEAGDMQLQAACEGAKETTGQRFLMYARETAPAKNVTTTSSSHRHETVVTPRAEPPRRRLGGRKTTQQGRTLLERVFRMALVPLQSYSEFHLSTDAANLPDLAAQQEQLMFQLTALMSRVNGIFFFELGAFFQLQTEVTLKLACLGQAVAGPEDAGCAQLPSNSTRISEQSTGDFLGNKGVDESEFDIGHFLLSGTDAAAVLGSLCSSGSKLRGMTSVPQPTGEVYFVDYVSHEIGHQLNASHTFRDCVGPQHTQLMPEAAVEPGSGSTIMAYASLCESNNNLQSSSDPYFHAISLEEMQAFLDTLPLVECGEVVDTQTEEPKVIVASECTVPLDTPFQLRGQPVGATGSFRFSWDRMDPGYVDYSAENTEGVFRSWKPSPSSGRFIPSLYNIGNAVTINSERLPTTPTEATFRFVARKTYSSTAQADTRQFGLGGGFATADTKVTFPGDMGPFRWRTLSLDLQGRIATNAYVEAAWDVAGTAELAPELDIGVALFPLRSTAPPFYDPEQHGGDLEFYNLGTVANTGSTELWIPGLDSKAERDALIMIRSRDPYCFFFHAVPVRLQPNNFAGEPVTFAPSVPPPDPEAEGAFTGPVIAGIAGAGACVLLVTAFLVSEGGPRNVLRRIRRNKGASTGGRGAAERGVVPSKYDFTATDGPASPPPMQPPQERGRRQLWDDAL